MSRLDTDRQNTLEPIRMQKATEELEKLGKEIIFHNKTEIQFIHNNKKVFFFPYSGWHSGSSIKAGRGLQRLLNQLK